MTSMPLFDLDRTALEPYLPDLHEPADFDAFSADTLAETRAHDLGLRVTPGEAGTGRLPAVVEYNGYGGGRGLPHERLRWAAAGYVSLFMDTRGQGSRWGSGCPGPVSYTHLRAHET